MGLDELKEINELIMLTKYYIEQGINITGKFSLHFSLSGNPEPEKLPLQGYWEHFSMPWEFWKEVM